MKTTLKNFYWVASQWNDPSQTAYHVCVVDEAENMTEVAQIGAATRERTLNMAQADTEGFTLAAISDAINADSLATIDSLNTQLAQFQTDEQAAETPPADLTEAEQTTWQRFKALVFGP